MSSPSPSPLTPTYNRNNKNGNKNNKKKKRKQAVPQKQQQAFKINNSQTYRPKIKKDHIPKPSYGLVASTNKMNIVSTNKMTEPVSFNSQSLQIAFYTFLSRMLFLGNIATYKQENPSKSYITIYDGASYLYQALKLMSSGATLAVNKVPRIFAVLGKLLGAKTVRFAGGGTIMYTPDWDIVDSGLVSKLTTPTGAIYMLADPTPAPTIPIPVFAFAIGDVPSYSEFIKVAPVDKNFGMELVDYDAERGLFLTDPSCYARSYPYFGSAGTEGNAVYSESELEVPFFYPYFSKLIPYSPDDTVIARVFHPSSGGLNTPVGLSTTVDKFGYADLKNPIPVIYKFLDFYQLYAEVVFWLVSAYNTQAFNLQGSNPASAPTPLPMTSSEFMIALRQAVLANFPEQCHAQFMVPVETNNAQSSIFQAFIVDSVTTPLTTASQLVIPAYILENLSMLRSVNTKITSTKGSNIHHNNPKKLSQNWVPVWGVYSKDVPPEPTYVDPEGATQFLFSQTPTIPQCQIWDAVSLNNSGEKVQINNYASDIMSSWNNQIELYVANKSTAVGPCVIDNNTKVSLLHYTRILKDYNLDVGKDKDIKNVPKQFDNFGNSYYYNKPGASKNKKIIAPATYYQLYTETITSHMSIASDVSAALRFLILPSIRLEYADSDKLTKNAYQVYTGELCSLTSTTGNDPTNSNEAMRLVQVAQTMIVGMMAPDPTNNIIVKAFATVTESGQGLDFLKSLMGGLSSLIPVVGPVLGSLLGG